MERWKQLLQKIDFKGLGSLLCFAIANALIWMFLGIRYFQAADLEFHWAGSLYGGALNIGHFGFIGVAFFLILALLRLGGKRCVAIGAVSLGSLLLLLDLANMIVFEQYKFHINPAMISLFFSPAGRELVTFPASTWVVVIVSVLAIIAAEYGLLRLTRRFSFPKIASSVAIVALLCFGSAHLVHAWSSFTVYVPVLMRAPLLPYTLPMTAEGFFRNCGFKPGEKINLHTGNSTLNYPLAPVDVNVKKDEKPLNILFVLLDSWRVDAFTKKIMPNMTERSKQGVVFRNHFSGSNCTRGGVFTLFYGIPASYWGSFLAANEEPVFMKTLREQNYELGIFTSATLVSPEFDRTVFAKVPNLRKFSTGGSKLHRDWNSLNGFLKFLKSRETERPFFGFLFLDLLHGYEPPDEFKKIFLPSWEHMDYLKLNNEIDTTPIKNLYYNTAYYQDTMLKVLFDELDKLKIPENTVIFISGDHAQELNDSKTNTWGHNSSFSRHQAQVPMIVFWPGRKPEEVKTLTSHFDVVPTVMERVFHTTTPVEKYASGRDIFDPTDREFLLMASYNVNAIFSGGKIFGLSRYGLLQTYDIDGRPTKAVLPRDIFQQALQELSRFYRH